MKPTEKAMDTNKETNVQTDIIKNLQIIKEKIAAAEQKAGRPEKSVKLMAVSKFHSSEEIQQAINGNQFLFGENRVQEAVEKFTQIKSSNNNIEMHIIGQLQSNKVKNAVQISDCIQSVDRIDLLKEIEKQCAKINKSIKVLFELHTGEESKSGFESKEALLQALELCGNNYFPHIIPSGFMTMAPFTENQTLIRNSFSTLRTVSQDLQKQFPQFELTELSMGMSGDFEIAIEEGSTLVRVGTAIFGERNYNK